MTRSEREQAAARAAARQAEIARARERFESFSAARQSVLRASYDQAESEAADVVNKRRREASPA